MKFSFDPMFKETESSLDKLKVSERQVAKLDKAYKLLYGGREIVAPEENVKKAIELRIEIELALKIKR